MPIHAMHRPRKYLVHIVEVEEFRMGCRWAALCLSCLKAWAVYSFVDMKVQKDTTLGPTHDGLPISSEASRHGLCYNSRADRPISVSLESELEKVKMSIDYCMRLV